jgi:hypothetical protein
LIVSQRKVHPAEDPSLSSYHRYSVMKKVFEEILWTLQKKAVEKKTHSFLHICIDNRLPPRYTEMAMVS